VQVREEIINFINENYPGSFAKIEMMNKATENPIEENRNVQA